MKILRKIPLLANEENKMTNVANIEKEALFNIVNAGIAENYEGLGTNAVQFTLITKNGTFELLEWVNEDRTSERTDSQMLTNQADQLGKAFNGLTEYKDAVHAEYSFYISEIFDALDAEIAKPDAQI